MPAEFTSSTEWPFEVTPSLLAEDRQEAARWVIENFAGIKQPLVETGPWVVTGDEAQGYGLHLRDYEGRRLPELPVPVKKVRELQIAFAHQLGGYEILREFTELRRFWLIEAEKLPDLDCLRAMPELEFFKFRNMECIFDLTPMRHHKMLRKLDWWGSFDQEAHSLDCLDGCDALEVLHCVPTFLVDDPDELITRFPKLRCVRAQFQCTRGDGGVPVLDRLRRARPEVIITDEYFTLNSIEW